MQDFKRNHDPRTVCGKCKSETHSGTHNGCEKCGKVKHTSGRRVKPVQEQ